jgi:cell division protein FtsB
MTWGMRWFVLVAVVILVFILFIAVVVSAGAQREHQLNMDCISQGKSYQQMNEDSYKLICK